MSNSNPDNHQSQKTTPTPNPATNYTAGATPLTSDSQPKNRKPIVIIALIAAAILLLVAVIIAILLLTQQPKNSDKTTTAETTITPISTSDNLIDLTDKTEDYYIKEAGEYTLTGTLSGHSVIIDVNAAVTLILKDVTINATSTAAIASINTGDHSILNITLADDTTNILTDGGDSDYDAALYSASPLTINGDTGILNITGQQEEGEGIATDTADLTIDGGVINITSADDGLNAGGDGGTITINSGTITIKAGGDGIDSNKNIIINGGTIYVVGSSVGGDAAIDADQGYLIHGGTVIALGSDMLEAPGQNSTQHAVAISLGSTYPSGATIQLIPATGSSTPVLTYTAPDSFRTVVLSSPSLSAISYNLFINDQAVQNFTLSSSSNVLVIGNVGTPGAPSR